MGNYFTNDDLSWMPVWDQMVGQKPPDWFVGNGATCAPDVWFGVDVRPAAHFHDWAYSPWYRPSTGNRDVAARYRADQRFLENLKRCGLGRMRYVYYYRVRLWGERLYPYSEGCRPRRTPWFWIRLCLGRYVTW